MLASLSSTIYSPMYRGRIRRQPPRADSDGKVCARGLPSEIAQDRDEDRTENERQEPEELTIHLPAQFREV